jgi:hypothetical protein
MGDMFENCNIDLINIPKFNIKILDNNSLIYICVNLQCVIKLHNYTSSEVLEILKEFI